MKTMCRPRQHGVWLARGLLGLAPLQAAVEIPRFSKQADGIAITWTAEPGHTYTLLSTDSITGAWEELTSLTADATTLSWTIPEPAGGSQRFYRVSLPAQTGLALSCWREPPCRRLWGWRPSTR